MAASERKFGQITGVETLGLFGVVLTMPLVQGWRLLWKPFVAQDRARTWRRVLADAGAGYATSVLNAHQIQFVDGTSQKVYEKWAATNGVKVDVEKIAEDGQLLWVTPRDRKRVMVYFHGGGFVLSMLPFTASFWKEVTEIIGEKAGDIGLAVLEYSLIPKAQFPTPLKQTIACIKHLIDSGVAPQDIFLVGDSAGAGLILQVIAHMLHPIPDVASVSLGSEKLGGVVLISPWVALDGKSPSFTTNDTTDIFRASFYAHVASFVAPSVPDSLRNYVEAAHAPKGWFQGLEGLVSRVMITAGEAECLKDDIQSFSKDISAVHSQVTIINIPGGTHNEPYGTYAAGDADKGEWPLRMADWLAEGITSRT